MPGSMLEPGHSLDQYVARVSRVCLFFLSSEKTWDVEIDFGKLDGFGFCTGSDEFWFGFAMPWGWCGGFEHSWLRGASGGLIHSGGEQGDDDIFGEFVIGDLSHEDFGFFAIGKLVDVFHGFTDFSDAEAGAGRDIDENLFSSLNLCFEEGRICGGFGGKTRSGFSGAFAHSHEGDPCILHDGLDVGKIDVDETGFGDDVADALDALSQDVIGGSECGDHGCVFVNDFHDFVVGHKDECVNLGFKSFCSAVSEVLSARSFEYERLCDDTDGQDSKSAGEFGNHWCGTGSGSATHSSGNEDHIATVEDFIDRSFGFACGFSTFSGVSAGSETSG